MVVIDYSSSVSESGSSVVGRSKSLGKPFFGKRTDSATSGDNYVVKRGDRFATVPLLFCLVSCFAGLVFPPT
jgi:hypothetical protein